MGRTSSAAGPGSGVDQFSDVVDAVLATSRVLVGVAARSIAPIEETLSLNQFRALVIIASRGSVHSAGLADAMGLHPSNATRTCDRLVRAGLLDRRDNPSDRRHLALSLTPAGRAVVDGVMHRRRTTITDIVAAMPQDRRGLLAAAFAAFADAAGEPAERDLWAVGYTTAPAAPG